MASYGDSEPPLPTLPFDLLVEILSWLPVKSLMQLRCTCKSWKSLISDSNFSKKQLRAAMSSTSHHHLISTSMDVDYSLALKHCPLLSVFAEETTAAMPLDCPDKNQFSFHMVGSCHGILCFRSDNDHDVLLWNPSIRKFTKLPPLENGGSSSYGCSFGYDNFSDSYKVVAVSSYDSCRINGLWAGKTRVKILTLGVKSWKTIQDFPFACKLLNRLGKFVSGTINWLVSRHSHSSPSIVSLDLNKESYRELLLPDFGRVATLALNLEMFKDCLCLFSHSGNFLDAWLMKEFGNEESWTKLFRVPHTGDLGYDSGIYISALYVSEDDQVLLDIDSEFVVYNSRSATFKDYVENIYDMMDSNVYVESLISPWF